ncbi:histidine phosphatase family protein [Paracoccus limosus]|nr:histidine phosphatase family protein [Paracoccus limosus]
MTPTLYLLRHGQTEWNAQGRLQGRLDSPLTALGRGQAKRQAQLIAALPPELQCWSSPAGRAVETARIALGGRPLAFDARLAEIDIGAFTGRTLSELQSAHPEQFSGGGLDWYDRTPQGEDFAALHARVRSFLDGLRAPAIIVTHGVTLRMIRLVAMGLPLARIGEMSVFQGALHRVSAGRHQVFF